LWTTPATKDFILKLRKGCKKLRLGFDPLSILLNYFFSRAVYTDLKGVSPLTWATDIYIILTAFTMYYSHLAPPEGIEPSSPR
jgi:hypothetical protein